MGEKDLKLLKTETPDMWNCLTKTLAYPYEFFNSVDDYQKHVDNLKKEDFFGKLKNKCPEDGKIEKTEGNIKFQTLKMVKN